MNNHDLVLLFIQLSVMLAAAVLLGQVARKLNQPAVLGELIGGILLGPTVFGAVAPGLHAVLFPSAGLTMPVRDAVIKLGMLFFLFVAGLEVDITNLRKRALSIAWTSASGIIVPFALGFGLVMLFPGLWELQAKSNTMVFALIIGIVMSISSIPIIARILMDLNLIKNEAGLIVMASATIDDLVGCALFAITLGNLFPTQASFLANGSIWVTTGLVLGFFTFFLTIGRWAAQRALPRMQEYLAWPSGFTGVIAILIMVAAAAAEAIGIHSIFGAFLVGVAFARHSEKRNQAYEMVHHFVVSFFAPIYFISVGLMVDFRTNFHLPLVLLVLIIACAGKIGGVTLGARIAKMPLKEALAVAFGMNARGMMGIVLASVAYEYRLIDQRVFVALIVMSIVTSMLSGPIMQRLLKEKGSK